MLFEAISGLHINMMKSKIYNVNEVPNSSDLAKILGCDTGSFPSTYLGLPLGASYKATEVWSGVMEKVEKKVGKLANAAFVHGW